jgi:hypothetical protein
MKFINPIIDYAHPMMMAEKGLKEAHNDLLEKKLAINSVKHIKEQK